jgi:hypothetical protein
MIYYYYNISLLMFFEDVLQAALTPLGAASGEKRSIIAMNHDTDDADILPDHHYESIYGREAMHARLLARLDAILKRMDARTEVLREDTARMDTTQRPARPQEG